MVWREARDILAATPNAVFASESHAHIAASITALHIDLPAATHIEPALVGAHLDRQGLLERVGGGAAIVNIWNDLLGAPSLAPKYATELLGLWRRWREIQLADEITYAALTGTDTSSSIQQLVDLQAHAGVDELALDDMLAALDDPNDEHPTILHRSDGQALLYAGAVNMFQSEPVVGKSMIAMIAGAEVINCDGHTLYFDHEDTPRRVARRMTDTLGLTRTQLADQFHYKRLYTLSPAAITGLPRLAASVDARLIIIDGMAEALASLGYDENIGTDIAAWWNTVARPLADTGACVVVLDHVTKSKENRGRWARGSGHKLAAVDGVAYTIDTVTPWSRTKAGAVKLTIAKDRPGIIGATGDTVAVIDLAPLELGEARLTWTTGQPVSTAASDWQGPTDCMALVRRLFTEHPDLELARSAIAGQLKTIYDKGYRDRTVREAADRLATEGVLSTRAQGKRGVYFRLNSDHHEPAEEELWEDF